MREYFADVERLWEELVLHAEDFRAIPGSVIVIGHITGRRQGLDVAALVPGCGRWRVSGGRATCGRRSADLGDLAARDR